MQPDIELIVKVQGIDQRALALRNEIATLPKHIAAIEKTLESHIKKLELDKALLAANQKDRRAQDGEIQIQQQKMSKLRDQMAAAKTNEQYKAFQHEIEFCEKAIKKCEDRILDLMEESEKLDQNVKAAESALKQEKAAVEKEKAAARERTAVDQKALNELMTERNLLAADVKPSVLSLYEKLAKKYNGFAISEVPKGRCSACNLEIRPQMYQDLRKGDQIMVCENCRRILHYNPTIAFDTASPSAGPAPFIAGGSRVDMS
jgi:hypothetical protein